MNTIIIELYSIEPPNGRYLNRSDVEVSAIIRGVKNLKGAEVIQLGTKRKKFGEGTGKAVSHIQYENRFARFIINISTAHYHDPKLLILLLRNVQHILIVIIKRYDSISVKLIVCLNNLPGIKKLLFMQTATFYHTML